MNQFLALLSPLSRNSYYLDPGSGSFIIQLLISGFVGIMFALRGSWSKIAGYFKKSGDFDSKESNDE